MKPTTEEILQNIYDSEINLSIGWMWDGGIDYKFGDLSGFVQCEIHYTCKRNISEIIIEIADDIAKEYPLSQFKSWWDKNKL